MARIHHERRTHSLRGAVPALLRAAIVALALSGAAFAAVAAPNKITGPQQTAFRGFVETLWPLAEARGVSRPTFDSAFAGVSFDPSVVASAQSQPEFARPIWDYVASAVSADRIERGRERERSERLWLARANDLYGVDNGVILGVWGLETDFGGFAGSNNIIRSLASLAYVRFQGDYFRDELLSALAILEEGDIAPSLMRGSWAGAMGQTQFMPSSYLSYAVAFQRHDRRDIWTSEADAIGSTANYLAKHGWTKGLPWGFEVRLPVKFPLTAADFSGAGAVFILRLSRRNEGRRFAIAGIGGSAAVDPRWAQCTRISRHQQLRRDQNLQQFDRLRALRRLARRRRDRRPRSCRPMADPRSHAHCSPDPKASSQTEKNGLRRRRDRRKNRRCAAFGGAGLPGA